MRRLLLVAVVAALTACGGGGGGGTASTPTPAPPVSKGAPVADAGSDFVATVGVLATLDGAKSVNLNGTTTKFGWTIVRKPTLSKVTIIDPATVNPKIQPDVEGVYEIQLITNDTFADSVADTVNVTAIPNGTFTLGSTQDSVRAVQGTPQSITNYVAITQWTYNVLKGADVTFSNPSGKVAEFTNLDGSLKVVFVVGNEATTATKLTIGSSKDDVIRLQGTPQSFKSYVTEENWTYNVAKGTYIRISTATGKVIGYTNPDGSLKF